MLLHTLLNVSGGRKRILASGFLTLCISLFSATFSASAAPGDLDPTFGDGGKVVLPAVNGVSLSSLWEAIVQPDGKILGLGIVRLGNPPGHRYRIGLIRLNADGTYDNSFDGDGRLLPEEIYQTYNCDFNLQPDGKIVLACRSYAGASFGGLTVYRYNSNGTPDASFDGEGIVLTNINTSFDVTDVVVQPDGKILVGGMGPFNGTYQRFAILRYNPDGSLDSSFGTNGVASAPTPNVNRHDVLLSLLLKPDGKIIATGCTLADSFLIYRFNANGTIDTSFGTNGEVLTPAGNSQPGGAGRLLPDGKFILKGWVNNGQQAFLRYHASGALDASFGMNGVVLMQVPVNGRTGAFEVQPDGRIVVSGYISTGSAEAIIIVGRYTQAGAPDASFGTDGFVATGFGIPGGSRASDVALQPDGKILVVGTNVYDKYSNNPVLARYLSGGAPNFDFDGDDKADVSIFRPDASAAWYWLGSSNNQSSGVQFGNGTDKLAPADFDGDAKTDIAVFRDGDWYRLNSSNNSFVAAHFGQAGDVPVPADYDGDAKADLAVYRQGDWYVLNSLDNSFRAEHFGIATDKPVLGDFDGDGKNDLAVYRAGVWYVQRSREGFFGAQFGVDTDKPVAADYDGDGKTDLAVYRPSDGVWYLLRSNLGFTATQFGIATDKPIPADYDGDGKTDVAVYRNGNWYLQQSLSGFRAVQYGQANDFPIPSAFVP